MDRPSRRRLTSPRLVVSFHLIPLVFRSFTTLIEIAIILSSPFNIEHYVDHCNQRAYGV